MAVEFADQTLHSDRVDKGIAPDRYPLLTVHQFQGADPAIVEAAQLEIRPMRPFLTTNSAALQRQQTTASHDQQPRQEPQIGVEVEFQPGQKILIRLQDRMGGGTPGFRKRKVQRQNRGRG